VALRTWDRLKLFIKEAGQVIVIMVLAINVLNSIGTDGSFGNEDTDKSILSAVGRAVTPVLSPMGIQEDNWPATVGIFTGVLAKETVVGTLDSLYSSLAADVNGRVEKAPFDLWDSLKAAAATVPENLLGVKDLLTDPLSLDAELTAAQSSVKDESTGLDVFGAMAVRFDGQAGAFAYLLFILLYFPCVATIGAIKRETGVAWAGFVAAWTTGVAYLSASLFYQAATYSRHPDSSLFWIVGLVSALLLVITFLRIWSTHGRQRMGRVGA
jgi:ferrous iron transport protein B